MGVGQPDSYLLRLFGAEIRQGFGHIPYQVGSSLTEKRGWRDVDVRLILPDDEYAACFGDPFTPAHDGLRLMSWNLAWSMLGRHMTRLPIDFQIQQQTIANDEFDGPRGALMIVPADIRHPAPEDDKARLEALDVDRQRALDADWTKDLQRARDHEDAQLGGQF